jgi:hypothetical protein
MYTRVTTMVRWSNSPPKRRVAPMLHRLFIVMPRRDIIEVEALEKYYAERTTQIKRKNH